MHLVKCDRLGCSKIREDVCIKRYQRSLQCFVPHIKTGKDRLAVMACKGCEQGKARYENGKA